MKTQIIKIIPCLLAGFILSACVGAVNLAEGAVDNIKINTKNEEEPIVVDPEVALINRCTTKDFATDASCAPIVADHPCIEDPFGGACDITFTDYYKTAQANRISFCRENPTHNLCTGAVKNVCDKTPFDADLCFSNNTYHQTHESMCEADPTAPRCQTTVSRICKGNVFHGFCDDTPLYESARIDDCIIGGNAGLARCKTSFTAEHCALNPFGAGCDTQSYSVARANRFEFCTSNNGEVCAGFTACEANPYGAGCGTHFEYKKVPTAKSWLQSLDSPLPKVPNTVNLKNEFLQGTEAGLDSGDAKDYIHIGGRDKFFSPSVTTLNFASNDFGGDGADGVAFFKASLYYYAGILSGTDLGARITETTGTAQWNGFLQTIGNTVFRFTKNNGIPVYANTNISSDFVLTVNFSTGEQAGTISGSASYYSLTGSFDNKGVITGTVERSVISSSSLAINGRINTSGTLIGLIGQEGAVGAFISNLDGDNNGYNAYSGGFVARPPE